MLTFYAEPAFFVLVALCAVPAVALGVAGRPIRAFGMAATALFVVLLFAGDVRGVLFFGAFVALALCLTFWVLRLFGTDRRHKVALYRVALAALLLPLAAAKVSAVFDGNVLGFVGISYLTFKAAQVLIEIRDGLIDSLSVSDYLYFICFFPVFTSGPIMRSRDFVAQLHRGLSRSAYLDLLARGLVWLLAGALYTFLLAPLAQWLMWFAPQQLAGAPAAAQVAECFGYGLFLFFDFAGYVLMARGVGAIFGIQVPRNFHAPFRSIDIKDFWNRWNMTLSFWLRDFVFMRLTRSLMRRRVFSSRLTTATCAFIAEMLLMGAWHGLTPSYLLYGLYHGALLSVCEVYQKKSAFYKRHRHKCWYRVCSWAITMVAVFFGFAIFSGQVLGLEG